MPDLYTKTLKGEQFLCLDKVIKRKTRVLLFASEPQLKMLFESTIILMDGTFSATPTIFDQVYCIHAIKFGQCEYNEVVSKNVLMFLHALAFPCVFGLLPDRKKPTYRFIFRELKSIANSMNLDFNPQTIMSDFEPALAEAISAEVGVAERSLVQKLYLASI